MYLLILFTIVFALIIISAGIYFWQRSRELDFTMQNKRQGNYDGQEGYNGYSSNNGNQVTGNIYWSASCNKNEDK